MERCGYTGKVMLDKEKAREIINSSVINVFNRKTGDRVNKVRRKRGEKRMYYCGHCEGWHLTSREKKEF